MYNVYVDPDRRGREREERERGGREGERGGREEGERREREGGVEWLVSCRWWVQV